MIATPIVSGLLYHVRGNGIALFILANNPARAIVKALDYLDPTTFQKYRSH